MPKFVFKKVFIIHCINIHIYTISETCTLKPRSFPSYLSGTSKCGICKLEFQHVTSSFSNSGRAGTQRADLAHLASRKHLSACNLLLEGRGFDRVLINLASMELYQRERKWNECLEVLNFQSVLPGNIQQSLLGSAFLILLPNFWPRPWRFQRKSAKTVHTACWKCGGYSLYLSHFPWAWPALVWSRGA